MHPVIYPTAILALTLLLNACGSTSVTQSWVVPELTEAPPQRLLVVAIADNETSRRAFEDAFTAALSGHGIESLSSWQLLPSADLHSQAAIDSAVQSAAADGIFITRLLGVEKREVSHPPSTELLPSAFGGFYPYYRQAWIVVHQPAYTSSHRIVSLETSLYSGASDTLLWSARTESWDIESEHKMMHEVVAVIVARMKADGLLDRRQSPRQPNRPAMVQ